jgi:HSP20-like domain of unknown function (DUF1813).
MISQICNRVHNLTIAFYDEELNMEKNKRTLKVYGMSGYNHNDIPTIMMKGKWLENFGFKVGQEYRVHCKN